MSLLEIDNDGEAAPRETKGKLGVLLVYEDFSTGLRAWQAFEQVARQPGLDADFEVNSWRMELLREAPLLERAAIEAAEADVVFLSVHGQGELPAATSPWLEEWFERRGGEPRALAVLLDPTAGDTAAANQRGEALRAAALAAGVDVFLQVAEAPPTERQSALDEIRVHPESQAAFRDEILHSIEPHHPYRDWGINE